MRDARLFKVIIGIQSIMQLSCEAEVKLRNYVIEISVVGNDGVDLFQGWARYDHCSVVA